MSGHGAAAAALRIVNGADTGRCLVLGDEQGVATAGTALLGEEPLVALATDSDCCDRCMATGLLEQAASRRRRFRCAGCGVNYCSEACRGAASAQHSPVECAAFAAIDRAFEHGLRRNNAGHRRNNWLRMVARTCLSERTEPLLESFCWHAADESSAAADVA